MGAERQNPRFNHFDYASDITVLQTISKKKKRQVVGRNAACRSDFEGAVLSQ
jgi:hypothetical protein